MLRPAIVFTFVVVVVAVVSAAAVDGNTKKAPSARAAQVKPGPQRQPQPGGAPSKLGSKDAGDGANGKGATQKQTDSGYGIPKGNNKQAMQEDYDYGEYSAQPPPKLRQVGKDASKRGNEDYGDYGGGNAPLSYQNQNRKQSASYEDSEFEGNGELEYHGDHDFPSRSHEDDYLAGSELQKSRSSTNSSKEYAERGFGIRNRRRRKHDHTLAAKLLRLKKNKKRYPAAKLDGEGVGYVSDDEWDTRMERQVRRRVSGLRQMWNRQLAHLMRTWKSHRQIWSDLLEPANRHRGSQEMDDDESESDAENAEEYEE